MKNYNIKVGGKQFIVKAKDKVDAVKKLRDAQNKSCDESLDEKERKAQEWVDYDIKHYGKVSETTKEEIRKMGLDFDKWDNQVKDSDIRDARPDRDTIFKIERAANNIRTNNISVAVAIDSDKDGVFIKEMYINTSGKWLETPQEADAYLRDLSNAIKFLKENYKYLGK